MNGWVKKNDFVDAAVGRCGFLPFKGTSNTISTLREDERRGRRGEVDVEYQCRCRVGWKEGKNTQKGGRGISVNNCFPFHWIFVYYHYYHNYSSFFHFQRPFNIHINIPIIALIFIMLHVKTITRSRRAINVYSWDK
jgi:hypothetical protein